MSRKVPGRAPGGDFQGFRAMELAGLEPATSWVRSGAAVRSNALSLQGVSTLVSTEAVTKSRPITGRFGGIWAQISALVASGRSRSDHGHAGS
jgi:hypothetical protein